MFKKGDKVIWNVGSRKYHAVVTESFDTVCRIDSPELENSNFLYSDYDDVRGVAVFTKDLSLAERERTKVGYV